MSIKGTIGVVLPAYAGMFPTHRAAHSRDLGSPRVCGDVSHENGQRPIEESFSPRMRGCFPKGFSNCINWPVLPAYAGMFPGAEVPKGLSNCSPRVCGDVSSLEGLPDRRTRFSPRMRGCFRLSVRERVQELVLPAYAGMFLGTDIHEAKDISSPRVCGDVSRPKLLIYKSNAFSPRMRGCFLS